MERYIGTQVSYTDITVTGGFWKERQDIFRNTTIGAVYDRFDETGRFEALKCEWKEGMPHRPHIFWESDVTKWIEGASYFLQEKRDPELEEKIDDLIRCMHNYQEEDGYLNAYFTVVEPDARFTRRTDHELYCAGHLIESAIAYATATGKDDLLDIACRYADRINQVFHAEHSAAFDTPGHEEIELALMKLYDYTKEERYKLLSEYFLNTRGTSARDETYSFADQKHMQSHVPVRHQNTAEGHSVRALYLYCGMADLAKANRDESLRSSCKTLFKNITEKRMSITGGIGSTHLGESFTYDYDLPEYTAYNETCASIALAMFCRRMWQIDADSRYADCAEQAIYNTVLSGISLSGDEFFYENPMAANPVRNAFNDSRPDGLKEHLPILTRVKVFDCSCCPPNLLRMVGSVADYMYTVSENTIYAHCYMDAEGEVKLGGNKIRLRQTTNYPYEDTIAITTGGSGAYTFAVRIPGWTQEAQFYINGKIQTPETIKGYAYLHRNWTAGDTISLRFPMKARVLEANPLVTELCGRGAVARGPIVYCAEGMDSSLIPLRDLRISRASDFQIEFETICGITFPALKTKAWYREGSDALYWDAPLKEVQTELRLIPYFAWANRGINEMTVWLLLKN